MTIYIDMYDALKEFKPDEWGTPDDDFTAGVNYVLNLLEEKYGEAVQPKEYGKWIFDDPLRGDFICSKCLGRQIVCSRYCPDCGAEMKEGE